MGDVNVAQIVEDMLAMRKSAPIMRGHTHDGAPVEVYVHPATPRLNGKVALLAVSRGEQLHHCTFEFSARDIERLAGVLAAAYLAHDEPPQRSCN